MQSRRIEFSDHCGSWFFSRINLSMKSLGFEVNKLFVCVLQFRPTHVLSALYPGTERASIIAMLFTLMKFIKAFAI